MLANYRSKLDEIENSLIKMVNLIIEANKGMLEDTKNRDFSDFDLHQDKLKLIEELAYKVDNTVVSTLALFSPEAKDLRELVAILKITNELSRAKSNIKNYSAEMKEYFQKELFEQSIVEKIILLQESSINSYDLVSTMIVSNDEAVSQKLYDAILVEEDKADELYGIIEQSVISSICDNSQVSVDKIRSLKSIRKLEKASDRTVGIADLIMFAQRGGELTH
ncbi:MAG: hypothetical protein ACQERK_05410 [Campylobacterota bacterium]